MTAGDDDFSFVARPADRPAWVPGGAAGLAYDRSEACGGGGRHRFQVPGDDYYAVAVATPHAVVFFAAERHGRPPMPPYGSGQLARAAVPESLLDRVVPLLDAIRAGGRPTELAAVMTAEWPDETWVGKAVGGDPQWWVGLPALEPVD